MLDLSDFIGTIVQETARARMLSDMESIRLAELYYGDMYLKHLPVPHFKMPEISIEMPVAVLEVNTPDSKVTNKSLMSKMRTRVSDDLSILLARILLTLKEDISIASSLTLRTIPTRVMKLDDEETALSERVKTSCQNINSIVFKNKDYLDTNNIPIRLTKLADDMEIMLSRELTANYLDYIGDKEGNVNEDALENILRLSREMFFDSVTFFLKEAETTLNIESSTSKLVEFGDIKYLTFIKITLREQDYEWTIGERNEDGIEERNIVIE